MLWCRIRERHTQVLIVQTQTGRPSALWTSIESSTPASCLRVFVVQFSSLSAGSGAPRRCSGRLRCRCRCLRGRRRRLGVAAFLGLGLDRLEDRAQRPARALEGGRELLAGAEDGADDARDRLLAGRQLAGGLDALVADIDLAVEEDAAQLELVVRLLLREDQAGDLGDARL